MSSDVERVRTSTADVAGEGELTSSVKEKDTYVVGQGKVGAKTVDTLSVRVARSATGQQRLTMLMHRLTKDVATLPPGL